MSTYLSKITVAGVDYPLPYDVTHQWEIVSGYEPPVQGWVVPKDMAEDIMATLDGLTGVNREATLTIGDPAGPLIVQRVIILGLSVAHNPQRRVLLLTDVRWYITRAWLNMDVNIRRRIGDRRLVGDTVIQDLSPVDTVAYANWSINNGSAYDWNSLKEQVLHYLCTARHGRPAIDYVTDFVFTIDPEAKIVQQTETDGPGTVGLARAIESIPGCGLYVDLEGRLHVHDRVLGAEAPLIEQLPPALLAHGDLVWVDNSPTRPIPTDHSWRVYVDYEIEVRCNYNATGSGVDVEFPNNASNEPYLIPVVQVTDRALFVPSAAGSSYPDGRTVAQGSWITQEEAFRAWGTQSFRGLTLPQLTDDIVAAHWFGGGLDNYRIGAYIDSFDPVWSARIDALMGAYRTMFRVNPNFWDRVRHVWAVRAAIWDPTTGTRAPSPVYANYNLTPQNRLSGGETSYFYGLDHLESYAESGYLSDGQPSGFRVRIEDEELGIIAIDRSDLSRFPAHTKIAPSPVVQRATFIAALAGNRTYSWQELRKSTNQTTTIAATATHAAVAPYTGWKLSTVLSCMPAGPNDLRRMYEIKVSTTDAATTAGLPNYSQPGFGPDLEERSQLAQARVAWQEQGVNANIPTYILNTFGALDKIPDIGIDNPETSLVPVNLEQELKPLGKALAACDLLTRLDHYEGTQQVPMNGDLVPLGSIARVTHAVREDRAVSILHCDVPPKPYRLVDFLPASARGFLLREIPSAR